MSMTGALGETDCVAIHGMNTITSLSLAEAAAATGIGFFKELPLLWRLKNQDLLIP
jgi:hypothetical protein